MPDDVTCQVNSGDYLHVSIGSLSPERVMFDGTVHAGLDLGLESSIEAFQDQNNNTNSEEEMPKFCRYCGENKKRIQLQLCQINFEEAIYLCVQDNCQFPLLEADIGDFIIKRNITQLEKVLKNRSKTTHRRPSSQRRKTRNASKSKSKTNSPSFKVEASPAPFVSPQSALQMLNLFPDDILQDDFNIDDSSSNETAIHQGIEKPPNLSPFHDSIEILSSHEELSQLATLPEELMETEETKSQEVDKLDDVVSDIVKDQALHKKNNEDSPPPSNDALDAILSDSSDSSSEKVCRNYEQKEDPLTFLMETSADPIGPPSIESEMLQFYNSRNSCWLDVLLQCFVIVPNVRLALNKATAQESDQSCLLRLCRLYDLCQQKLSHNVPIQEAEEIMEKARNSVLSFLASRFQLQPGAHEGAAEMFKNMMKLNKGLSTGFSVTLRWEFECDSCEHKDVRRVMTELVSFLSSTTNFHPLNAMSLKSCSSCGKDNQTLTMIMEKVPICVMMHFQQGLSHNRFSTLDFGLEGCLYSVCAVIQYITEPFNHFIVWIRDCKANKWMCCDDLQKSTCSWQKKAPKIPPKQIHMVMWEKQGAVASYFLQDSPSGGAAYFMDTVVNLEAALSDDEIVHESDKVETIILEDAEEDQKLSPGTSSSERQDTTIMTLEDNRSNKIEATSKLIQTKDTPSPYPEVMNVDDGITNIVLSDSDSSEDINFHCKRTSSLHVLSPTPSEGSMSGQQTSEAELTKDDTKVCDQTSSIFLVPNDKTKMNPVIENKKQRKMVAMQPVVKLEDIMKTPQLQEFNQIRVKRKRDSVSVLSDDRPPQPKLAKLPCNEISNLDKIDKESSTDMNAVNDDDDLIFVSQTTCIGQKNSDTARKSASRSFKGSIKESQKSPAMNQRDEEFASKPETPTPVTEQITCAKHHKGHHCEADTMTGNTTVELKSKTPDCAEEKLNEIPSLKARVKRSKERRRTRSQTEKASRKNKLKKSSQGSLPNSSDQHITDPASTIENIPISKELVTENTPALETQLKSLFTVPQSAVNVPISLPSYSTEIGGLAVVKTSPPAFQAQPTFVYRPPVPSTPTPPPSQRTFLNKVDRTTTDFRKLSNTKTRQKSRLLGPGSKFESYTPKKFRLVGYEKKNLKQADGSDQSPYRSSRSNLRGNRPASCESSDKSSEVSEFTDIFPGLDRASSDGSFTTKSSAFSKDFSTYGGSLSQRTSPFTVSRSPSSVGTAVGDLSNNGFSSLTTDAQDTTVVDDILDGLVNGDGPIESFEPSTQSRSSTNDDSQDLEFLLDF